MSERSLIEQAKKAEELRGQTQLLKVSLESIVGEFGTEVEGGDTVLKQAFDVDGIQGSVVIRRDLHADETWAFFDAGFLRRMVVFRFSGSVDVMDLPPHLQAADVFSGDIRPNARFASAKDLQDFTELAQSVREKAIAGIQTGA